MKSYTDFTYADKTNYLTGIKHYSPIGTQNITYTYGNLASGEMPDQIYGVKWNGQEKVKYTYDGLGRLTNKTVGGLNNTYTYENVNATRTTTLVKTAQTANGTYTYTYDNVGNIVSIHDGTYTTSYEYDSLNQLVRENDQRDGATYTYSYVNGNITEKKAYAYTTGELGEGITVSQWTYGDGTWSDLLTEYNEVEMTYDTIGNMVTIGDIELTWSGRQLQSVSDGGYTVSYQYNADGQRISKDVDGTLTEFFYNGSILAGQKTDDYVIVFMYDNNGDIFGFTFDGTEYYYVKNAQNDVVALANSSGTIIANYYYDAWGRVIDITGNKTIAYINPILYRSYYYDYENGFYYLNSRYYSADICRFINADGLVQTGQGVLDKNMFAYCMNNPIMYRDSSGQSCEFTITIPAEDNGPATVPTGYSVTSSKNSSGTYTYTVSPACNPQVQLVVAQTIYGEGGGRFAHSDWQDGQRAVATVIVNRTASPNFPDDFEAVCSQNAQFSGYLQGKKAYESECYDTIMWDNAMLLAEEILSGNFTPHPNMNSDYLYFHSASYGNSDTIKRIKEKPEVVIAGGNMFYVTWP